MENMNMRNYSLPIYPATKRKLEELKEEKNLTWDELFNYLLEEIGNGKKVMEKQ